MGLLDYVHITETQIEKASAHINNATVLLNTIGLQASLYAKRFEESNAVNFSASQKRALINEYSEELENDSKEMRTSIESARISFNEALDSMLSAINIQLLDFPEEDNPATAPLSQLEALKSNVNDAQLEIDLPLKFHPLAIRVSGSCMPSWAV
jgi:hypothetical protein